MSLSSGQLKGGPTLRLVWLGTRRQATLVRARRGFNDVPPGTSPKPALQSSFLRGQLKAEPRQELIYFTPVSACRKRKWRD